MDRNALTACPLVRNYTWYRESSSRTDTISNRLLTRLSGHRVVILGDSMARQVFSVLVGLLRKEQSFLDFHSWNPARYQFWRQSAAHAHDELDIFYRPLACPTPACSTKADPEEDWSTVPFRNEGPQRPAAEVDVTWVPMPYWSSVNDALRVTAAAERATGRPFTMYLVFVPSAWELDSRDTRVPLAMMDRIPSYFWDEWSKWMAFGESHLMARYAALTMPIERIIDCIGPANSTNQLMMVRHRLTEAFIERKCGPSRCCLGRVVADWNKFHHMSPIWQRVDFAAVTAARHPLAVSGGNWHYECFMTRPGATECAHRPRARLGLTGTCNDALEKYFKRTTTVAIVPRENGDCAEEGNTQMWSYLLEHHPSWFERTRRA